MADAPMDLPAILAGIDEELTQLQTDLDALREPVIDSARRAIAEAPRMQERINNLRGQLVVIRELCV